MIHANSWTRRILDYIEEHPGATRAEIYEATNPGDSPISSLSNILRNLREAQAIQTVGHPPHESRWHPTPIEKAKPLYETIAMDLIEELQVVHHTNRVAYLAKRLEELFS